MTNRTTTRPAAPATDRQIEFLRALVAERQDSRPEGDQRDAVTIARAQLEAFDGPNPTPWLTKPYLSEVIDKIKRIPADRPAAAPARTNRFAATCTRCGSQVPAEAGELNNVDGRWVVTHRDGDCSEIALPDVPAGHYAIASSGDNDLAFYRVDRPAEGRWAGRTFVKQVIGGHPDAPVRRDAVPGVLARIMADGVEDSARRYGREIGRCCLCNRTLTDEASRAAGIGPDCAQRF